VAPTVPFGRDELVICTGGGGATLIVTPKAALAVCPLVSVSVTLTVKLPDWLGLPETSPELAFRPTPGGRPVAAHK
jgi:hypothetical protein